MLAGWEASRLRGPFIVMYAIAAIKFVENLCFENEFTAENFSAGKANRFALAAALHTFGGEQIGPEIGEIQFYLKFFDVDNQDG